MVGFYKLTTINDLPRSHYHIFNIILNSKDIRNILLVRQKKNRSKTIFHYLLSHGSEFYGHKYCYVSFLITKKFAGDCYKC